MYRSPIPEVSNHQLKLFIASVMSEAIDVICNKQPSFSKEFSLAGLHSKLICFVNELNNRAKAEYESTYRSDTIQ